MRAENWVERIQYWYWDLVPYNYRPKEIWYQAKCFFWKRYTTVKSRHLPHTWCDKVELVPYTLFEMLETFVEKECSPGHVNWYSDHCPHKIMVGMEYKNVRDEMDDLLKWWNEEYIPYAEGKHPEQLRFDAASKEYDDLWDKFWFPQGEYAKVFDPEKELGKEKYAHYLSITRERSAFEVEMESKLESMCHRIINIRKYLWT
jgi:hypothetical protein